MDMGIVNAGMLQIYDDIEAGLLKIVEDAVLNRHDGATEALLEAAEARDEWIYLCVCVFVCVGDCCHVFYRYPRGRTD